MLLELTRWLERSMIGQGIHNSSWLFPFIETFHLIALAIMGGAVLIVNLRLFGWGLRGNPVSEVARDVQPVLNTGIAILLVSGFFLYASEGAKMYFNGAFRIKMISLALAIICTYTWHRRIAGSDDAARSPMASRTAAALSLLLWAGVGLSGRAIGFV